MKYLSTSSSAYLRYQPEVDRIGYRLNLSRNYLGLDTSLVLAQDDGNTVLGERMLSAGVTRRGFTNALKKLQLSISGNLRQQLGNAKDNHATAKVYLQHTGDNNQTCRLGMLMSHEQTVASRKGSPDYQKAAANLKFICETKYISLDLRHFHGATRSRGEVADSALWRPQNLSEGRLRLDQPLLPGGLHLLAYSSEVSIPARLSLPDSWLVLPSRAELTAYFDIAETFDVDQRAKVGGLGFRIPLGGDISGRGTMELLRFSVYSVLYRNINDKITRNPGWIFNIGGSI